MANGFVYDFQSGWKVIAGARRPDRCDICKIPCKTTKPAYNTQNIRCFMCDSCRERWNAFRRKYYAIDQSKIDACRYTGLTAFHMHEDDPESVPVFTEKPAPRGDRQRIKYLEYERELKRLQEAT